MRLVVDTNVFVSAALKENSLPFRVVRWIEQHHGVLKSLRPKKSCCPSCNGPILPR